LGLLLHKFAINTGSSHEKKNENNKCVLRTIVLAILDLDKK